MRILFEQGTPAPLRDCLSLHEVSTAFELGWSRLRNGELLDAAEGEGFGVLVTNDSKMKFQQNLDSRRIAIVVLLSTSWPRIEKAAAAAISAIATATPGSYTEVEIP